jgi:hypothetical protein
MDANRPSANDNDHPTLLDPTGPGGPGGPPAAGAPPPQPPRRGLTTAILGFSVLTLLVVIGAERRSAGGPRPAPRPADPGVATGPTSPANPPVADPPAPPATPPPPTPIAKAPAARPQVELVFALDTTSSMSGLIEGAKRKIWSLASFVAQGQPTPDLRVGLIGYRDIGDAYVTKVFDLDADLDRVYRRLRAFAAEGGGDTPEHVARALDESVHKMSWSQSPAVVKVIYLVGDAPPHTDYDDGYDYARAARAAKAKGIQLHTIQCGTDGSTEPVWRRIAALGGGQFMAIRQDGGMHEERTRYDDELAALHDKLADTTIAYGVGGLAATEATRVAAAAPASVKAERATFLAKKHKGVAGGGDLVDAVAHGSVKLDEVQGELPAEMRSLDRAKQAEVIAAKQKDREAITRRIDELAKLRTQELDKKRAEEEKAGGPAGFDDVAKKALRDSVKANARSGLKL